MALTPDALEYRETPVVNSSFVVVQLAAAAAATDFLAGGAGVLALVNAVDAAYPGHTYPEMPIGVLISANTTAVQILTDNATADDATGINIPIGQSLYLPMQEASVATIQYISGAGTVSVACFYTE